MPPKRTKIHCPECVPAFTPDPDRAACIALVGTSNATRCGRPADKNADGPPYCSGVLFERSSLPSHLKMHEEAAKAAQEQADALGTGINPEPDDEEFTAETDGDPETEEADQEGQDLLGDAAQEAIPTVDRQQLLDDIADAAEIGAARVLAPSGSTHSEGICADGDCSPCATSRQEINQSARRDVGNEMQTAVAWADEQGYELPQIGSFTDAKNVVAQALQEYRLLGSEEATEQVEVEVG